MSRYRGRHAGRHADPRTTRDGLGRALRLPAVSGALVVAAVATGAAQVQASDSRVTAAMSGTTSPTAVAQSQEMTALEGADTAHLVSARNAVLAVDNAAAGRAQVTERARVAAVARARAEAAARAARDAQRTAIIAGAQSNPRAAAQQLLGSFGFGADQIGCLIQLWNGESGWNFRAANPSGAYGIPQALPGSKMASAGADWATNPVTQITWGLGYIKRSYGSPCNALGLWQSRYPHWY